MKRCTAILTLALSWSMAHSALAFPHFTTFDNVVVNDPGDRLNALLDRVDPNGLIAVAIIGFESGEMAAYEMLLDMGFSPAEAPRLYEAILYHIGDEPAGPIVSEPAFADFTTFDNVIVNDSGDSLNPLLDRVDHTGVIAYPWRFGGARDDSPNHGAVIGFEHDPEAAFVTLLDKGFSHAEAESLCQDVTYEW